MRGRKPKPTPLKLLRGTQPCRVNTDEPIAPPGRPECPKHLDADARGEWDRIVVQLEAMKVLTTADGAALAVYCGVFSRWIKARKRIDETGLVVSTAAGGDKTNPAVSVAERCEGIMMRCLVEFGCTPSSRSRIKLGSTKDRDALAEFQTKRPARANGS